MSRLKRREPFGKAGFTVAICALVFAVAGGAYAAGGLTKSQEKQVTKIAKKFAGTNGAQGLAGPQGAPGTPGTNGTNGKDASNGKDGSNGQSVIASHLEPGEGGCAAGGTKLTSASGAEVLCNGENGSPWTAGGTLPPGKSLQGDWSIEASSHESSNERFSTNVSFLLPLEEAPTAHYIRENDKENFFNSTECTATVTQHCEEFEERTVPECPGNAEEPEALPGNLCVYASREEGVDHQIAGYRLALPNICAPGTENPNAEIYEVGIGCIVSSRTADRFGFTLLTVGPGSGFVEVGGTWAVTAKAGA